MERTYNILLVPEPDNGGFSVKVPALPGCVTHGRTVEQCIQRAKEAIAVYIETLEDAGESIPVEQAPPQIIAVNVAA